MEETEKSNISKIFLILIPMFLIIAGLAYWKLSSKSDNKVDVGDGFEQQNDVFDFFPRYPGSVNIDTTALVSLEVTDSIPRVMSWYFDELINLGWAITDPPEDALNEEYQSLIVKKDNEHYLLEIYVDEEKTIVSLKILE